MGLLKADKMPDFSDTNQLPDENTISRTLLPNNIVVLCKPDFLSPSVVVNGYLLNGSMQDPPNKLGLALFTSYALMRGAKNRSGIQIYRELETAGASFGFGASVQTTSFGGRSLIEDLPLLLRTLADCIREPRFPEDQIRKLKMQLLTGLLLREQDTSEMASMRFDAILFPNHPYGVPEDGYFETVQSITRKDLVHFHQHYYGPEGMVIIIVGAVTPQQANDLVYDAIGDWHNTHWQAPGEMPDYQPLQRSETDFIAIADKFQMDLILGCHGPCRNAPEFLAASLGNNILGQFGMMGRIGEAVREKSGLAYYASSSLNAMMKGGSWEISAGINPENYHAAIKIIREELSRFITFPVSVEELEDVKASAIGSLPLSLESNNGVANLILRMERFGLGLNYIRNYSARVAEISQADILQVAQRYIDLERLVIVSAGPSIAEPKNK